MPKTILQACGWIVLGGLIMLGMRAVEWAVPKPKQAVVFCVVDSGGKLHGCKALAAYLLEGE